MSFWGVLMLFGLSLPFPGTDGGRLEELGFRRISGANGVNEVHRKGQKTLGGHFVVIQAAVDNEVVFMVSIACEHSRWLTSLKLGAISGCAETKRGAECEVPGGGPRFAILKCGKHHLMLAPPAGQKRRVDAEAMCQTLSHL